MIISRPKILFCKNLFQLGIAGERINLGNIGFALNQRQHIGDELFFQAVVCIVDPLQRNLLFIVGNGLQREKTIVAAVFSICHLALKGDHVTGLTGNGFFHRNFTGSEGLFNIGSGSEMRASALQKAELNAADLGAGVVLHDLGKHGSKTAELCMTKAVSGRGLCLGNEAAVGIVDSL